MMMMMIRYTFPMDTAHTQLSQTCSATGITDNRPPTPPIAVGTIDEISLQASHSRMDTAHTQPVTIRT